MTSKVALKNNLKKYLSTFLAIIFIFFIFSAIYAQSWQKLPLYGGGAQFLAISPNDTLYSYCLFNGGLSISPIDNISWNEINIPVTRFSEIKLMAMAISSDGSIVTAWKDLDAENLPIMIYRSTDIGITWQAVDTLQGSNVQSDLIKGAANTLFLMYNPFDFNQYPLLRTTDNGLTWSTIVPDSQTNNYTAIGANKNGYVVAGSYNKLFLSANNGDSWVDISSGFPGYGAAVIALNDSNHIFVATWEGQIYRSSNYGETWEIIYQDNSGGTIQQIAFNSNNDMFLGIVIYNQEGLSEYRLLRLSAGASQAETSFSARTYSAKFLITNNDYLFLATAGSIYRSIDNGQTWSETINGLTHYFPLSFASTANGDLFVATHGAALRKILDQGLSWQVTDGYRPALDWINHVAIHNNALYAATDSGVFKSSDLGENWTRITTNIYSAQQITWGNDGTAYLISENNRLYRTTTDEQTWQAMSSEPFTDVDVNSIITVPSGAIFIGVDSLGVFRSLDNGSRWIDFNNGLPRETAHTFAIDSSGGLFVSMVRDSNVNRYYGGLYRLPPSDSSWQSVNSGLPGTGITSIVVNSKGDIYASSIHDGVYHSTDNGQTWTAVNTGLPENLVYWSLALDKDEYLYLGTASGIFRTTQSTTQSPTEINVQIPTEPETGKDMAISVTKDPNFQPTIMRLYYRKPGDTVWQYVEYTGSGDSLAFVIPADSISYEGLEYYVYLSDGTTEVTYPPVNPQENPISLQVRVASQTAMLNLSPYKYRMVSVPLILDNPSISNVLIDDYGEPDSTTWRLLRWISLGDTAGLYLEYPYLQDDFSPGNAFWLITRDGKTFDVDSAWSNNLSEPFDYVLRPGWNQIGNPFPFPVPSDSVQNVQEVDPPVFYDGTQYQYDQKVLQPWEGYFVYNRSGQELTISVPPIRAQTSLPKQLPKWKIASEKGFSLRLKAQMRNTKLLDTENFIGFSEFARDEIDEFDLAEAPPIGEYLQLFVLEDGKKFTANFKSVPRQGQQWNLRLQISKWINFPIDFTIEEFGNLPEGFHVYILDKNDQRMYDISDGKFSLNLPRNTLTRDLKIIIGTEKYASAHSEDIPLQPMDYKLEQNYPNPFNGATTISYQLAKRSRVKLEIYNILGRKIRTLVDEIQATGNYKIHWDATDNQNRPVSSGVYFYRLKAEKFTAAKKLLLIR